MKRSIGLATFLSAVALHALVGTARAEDPIVIGIASGQTGTLSPWDEGAARGAQLAIEDINEAGGVLGRPLKVAISDTKSDPSLAPTAALEVLDEGAEMVLVACDYDFGSPAAVATLARGKIAIASCAADAKFGVQGVGPMAYTMALATNGQGALLAEFAAKQEGWDKVYIMRDTSIEYTKSLCDNFRLRWVDLKGEESIVGEDTWNGINDTSIAGQISRIKATADAPKFIMWCGFTNNGSMLRQVRSAGISVPILGSESMDGSYWLEAVPDLTDFYIGVYASIHGNDPDPKVAKFMERYAATFGEPAPMGHVVTGYTAVEAWARAANKAGSLDANEIKAALDSFDNEPLLTGPASFSPELHINLKSPLLMMHAVNGKYEIIGRVAPEKVYPPKF